MNEAKARLHEVQVRYIRTDSKNAAQSPEGEPGLGAEERLHLARIRKAEERRDFLAAHALARRMLAHAAGCPVAHLRFRLNSNGRFEVAAPASAVAFRLGVAHADGVALCAISHRRGIGASVESGRTLGPLGVASSLCSQREQQALRSLTSKGVGSLVSLWTLKEAIAKAAGQETPAPSVVMEVGGEANWQVAVWRLTADHYASVAVCGAVGGESLAIRCLEDGPSEVLVEQAAELRRA